MKQDEIFEWIFYIALLLLFIGALSFDYGPMEEEQPIEITTELIEIE